MSELEFLVQLVKWGLGLGTLTVSSAFAIIWWEIRSLRKVRHEDREMIARVSLDNDMLTAKVQEQMEDQKNRLKELTHENQLLKYMLKAAGQSTELETLKK